MATPFSSILMRGCRPGGSRPCGPGTRCSSYLYQLFHIVSIAGLQQDYNHSAQPSPAGAQTEAGEGAQASGRDRTILYVQLVKKESDNRATWFIIRGAWFPQQIPKVFPPQAE